MPDLVVAGAGMAGLAAAAEARGVGATVTVLERGDRPGGSMLLSSGVVWRYRDFDVFRAECPDGDPALQLAMFENLDADLRWLESLGARVVARETGNPLTTGARFDPESLTAALIHAAGAEVRAGRPPRELPDNGPGILATGGFQADRGLVREHVTPQAGHLLLRGARWSSGDGLRLGLAAGGERSGGMEQIYGRNMPAPPARVGERDFVQLAQLSAHHATVTNERGEPYEVRTWSEIDVVQWTALQPRARAWFRLDDSALEERVRERTVGDMVDAAAEAGAAVERSSGSGTFLPRAGTTSLLR